MAEDVVIRLRRIEGQVRGLARMVEEKKPCEEILTQLMAVRSALDQAGLQIISRYLNHCLPDSLEGQDGAQLRQNMQRVLELLLRMH